MVEMSGPSSLADVPRDSGCASDSPMSCSRAIRPCRPRSRLGGHGARGAAGPAGRRRSATRLPSSPIATEPATGAPTAATGRSTLPLHFRSTLRRRLPGPDDQRPLQRGDLHRREQAGRGDRVEQRMPFEAGQEGVDEGGVHGPARRRQHRDATGQARFLQLDHGHLRQQLSGRQDRTTRVGEVGRQAGVGAVHHARPPAPTSWVGRAKVVSCASAGRALSSASGRMNWVAPRDSSVRRVESSREPLTTQVVAEGAAPRLRPRTDEPALQLIAQLGAEAGRAPTPQRHGGVGLGTTWMCPA